jgi:predicted DNA-binding ribbon-helix-helix protein
MTYPAAPKWCNLVYKGNSGMPGSKRSKSRKVKSARASVSFPSNVYEELERLAAAKKVSIAWVVREAAERYVVEQWPLLGPAKQEET